MVGRVTTGALHAHTRHLRSRNEDVVVAVGHERVAGAVRRRCGAVAEEPVEILYPDYSKSKGQPLLNSINILADTVAHRISHGGRS